MQTSDLSPANLFTVTVSVTYAILSGVGVVFVRC